MRPCGTVVLKTTVAGTYSTNLAPIVIDEIRVIGSRCGPFPKAIAALAKREIDVRPLIGAEFALDDAEAAFRAAAERGRGRCSSGLGVDDRQTLPRSRDLVEARVVHLAHELIHERFRLVLIRGIAAEHGAELHELAVARELASHLRKRPGRAMPPFFGIGIRSVDDRHDPGPGIQMSISLAVYASAMMNLKRASGSLPMRSETVLSV